MAAKMMTCEGCGKRDHSLYVTGCPDCGEDRVEAAKRQGCKPSVAVFVPNRLCRECCISGHGTRSW